MPGGGVMRRLLPRSLRARMLALSVGATLLALACAAWVMAGTLERFVTRGVDQRLDAQLAVLASAVSDDGTVDTARLRQRLAVLEDGPGWRWRIDGPRGRVRDVHHRTFRSLRSDLPGHHAVLVFEDVRVLQQSS